MTLAVDHAPTRSDQNGPFPALEATQDGPTAIETCRESIARHSKSFALASRLLPGPTRDSVAVVYAWCRRADDAIDLSQGSAQRAALMRLRSELAQIYSGATLSDPILGAFQRVALESCIPKHYPNELLNGMEMDALGYEYETWSDLMRYCYRVASTVGLMMCHVMGVRDAAALPHAAHLGAAMQLTNIARDVGEDWERGRLYLPEQLLANHGLRRLRGELGSPLAPSAHAGLRGALRQLLATAERLYQSGDRGLCHLSPRCEFSVRAARLVYSAIGDEIARRDYDVFASRAVVPKYRKLWLCLRAALRTAGRHGLSPAPFKPALLKGVHDGTNFARG